MKNLIAVLCGVGLSFGVAADGHIPDPQDWLVDRVGGTYRLQCTGYRIDGGDRQDWIIGKDQLNYLAYGKLSHSLVEFFNQKIGTEANDSLGDIGYPPIYEGQ